MVAAGVLGFSRQAFYKWCAKPVSDRQAQELQLTAKIRLIHAEDPEFGYRFIADELGGQGVQICERWGVAVMLPCSGVLSDCQG